MDAVGGPRSYAHRMGDLPVRRLPAAIRWPDVAIAVAVGLFMIVGAAEETDDPLTAAQLGLLGLAAAVLLGMRRFPVTVFVTTMALHLGYLLLGHPEAYEWLATTVALSALTRAHGWRVTAPLVAVLVVGSTAEGVVGGGLGAVDAETLLTVLGLSTAVVVGQSLRTRQAWIDAVSERAVLAERTREQEARQRAAEERLRVAREVHDVVAHALASINVQAGMGEHVGQRDPDRAATALTEIRQASSAALDELRSVLEMLRHDEPVAPAASLDDLDRLVGVARAAGLDADLVVTGTGPDLDADVERAAYRILQEAVTNAVRHAGDATLHVRLDHTPEALAVTVEDDGAGTPADTTNGHGLQGMRERAAQVGGSIEAGPRDPHGFRVHATLPRHPEEAP